jgi:oxygen-independent coproporphyrinogen-3 oxidase
MKELTVEAGRPDTITREKLDMLKSLSVDRISINPQTFKQETLDLIGRKHLASQVVNCYKIAKEAGFEQINMDLIIGLPGETLEDVDNTFKQLMDLNPSDVTVHTLAVKRSSAIHENKDRYPLPSDRETLEQLDVARTGLMSQGYKPYYLYRQKNMVGSYENVGYYKGDVPCIYNIEIMEEIVNIIAFGAGAITKMIGKDGKVTRVENVKNADQYMKRIDEMIKRKVDLL